MILMLVYLLNPCFWSGRWRFIFATMHRKCSPESLPPFVLLAAPFFAFMVQSESDVRMICSTQANNGLVTLACLYLAVLLAFLSGLLPFGAQFEL